MKRLFLCEMFVLFLVIAGVSLADPWDGESIDISWYNESDNEFSISNAAEFAGLAKLINDKTDNFAGKTIQLENDIDLGNVQWNPIGVSNAFSGTLDGKKHTISNVNINYSADDTGLFSQASDAIFNNITISGNASCSSYHYIGLLVGIAENSTFENITSEGIVHGIYVSGGIVGVGENCTFSSCINNASVSSTGNYGFYSGGITGYLQSGLINDCVNNASVKATNNSGGIVGYSLGVDVSKCINNGENIQSSSANGSTGGIIGATTYSCSISDCANNANISATNYVGGIIGQSSGRGETIALNDCINLGNISSSLNAAGGIVAISSSYTYIKFIGCNNKGSISGVNVGGVIGALMNNSYNTQVDVENCNNSANVTGSSVSGGIIGCAYRTSSSFVIDIVSCVNSGNIESSLYSGGITGYLYYSIGSLGLGDVGYEKYQGVTLNATDCKNSGSITSAISGGILGELYYGVVNHCINLGTVTTKRTSGQSIYYAGGIIGTNAYGTLINSANYGSVLGDTIGNGGLVGNSFTTFIRNSYNKADVSASSRASGISGIWGKDFNRYEQEYTNITNTYNSGDLSGSVNSGVANVWQEGFDRGFYKKDVRMVEVYDNKLSAELYYDHIEGGSFTSPTSELIFERWIYNDGPIVVLETPSNTTLLDALELETQEYNLSNNELPYLHWVQPQSDPSPYGSNYDGNLYPVFGYPITFVIYTDGEISSVGGSLGSTDATQIEDFFNGGYLQDYYGANGDAIKYTAKANKGYAFEKSETATSDITLTDPESSITNGFTMRALNTNEDPVIINLYFVSQYTVTISKIWDDADNEDLIRPTSLSMSLALNGTIIKDINEEDVTVLLQPDEDGYWQSDIITLPNGDYENLEIWEGSSTGYSVEKRSVTINGHDISAVVVNRHDPSPKFTFTATNESMVNIKYEVTKTWNDEETVTTFTHPDIVVQVFKETDTDLVLVAEQTLTSTMSSVTFNDLPKYEDNDSDTLVAYTIKEFISDEHWVNIGNVWYNTDGLGTYTATVTNATITGETEHDTTVSGDIENKYELLQKTIDVEVTKMWNDHSNENKIRPESIKLGLFKYSTDENPVKTVELKKEDTDTNNTAPSWTGKFEDLDLYDGSEFIDYTKYVVKEWDPATSRWIFYGDSMIITSGGLEYTYIYDKQ